MQSTLSSIIHRSSSLLRRADRDMKALLLNDAFHNVLSELCALPVKSDRFNSLFYDVLLLSEHKYIQLEPCDMDDLYSIVMRVYGDFSCIHYNTRMQARFWKLIDILRNMGYNC